MITVIVSSFVDSFLGEMNLPYTFSASKKIVLNQITKAILVSVFVLIAYSSSAQLFVERTSDSTWKFIGESGLVSGSYTYDQFAPDFYLEGFRLQLKNGIYYRSEGEKNAFRLSLTTASGKVNHIAKQYYEIKDTINLNGSWNNTGLQIGFEHFLYQKNNFRFYSGADAVYRRHKFSGAGKSMFDEMNFHQNIKSYAVGTELFFGIQFTIKQKIKLSMESAYSVITIFEHANRIYPQSSVATVVSNSTRFSMEPSPFNRISIGYKF
jgi:hypothetical protein